MPCPNCNSKLTTKVIAAGLPMKYCSTCHTLWGEPWASLYTFLIAPLEGMLSGGFMFFPYKGNYVKALWEWFTFSKD